MPEHFEVIIVGLGAMGSATAYHLARSGKKVLGLDGFTPPHAFGSSHGQSRIIREAYFEDPIYVPLVQRAYELWAELERISGRKLLRQTGGLMIGPAAGALVAGAKRSADEHGLKHERLSADEVTHRFPALRPSAEMVAIWEPRAGFLLPEFCVWAHLDAARMHRAELRWEEAAVEWEAKGKGVRLVSSRSEYSADRLILTAGPWIGALVPELKDYFTIERQVQFWFEPAQADLFSLGRCPIYMWEYAPAKFFYGFPDLGGGVKVAGHHEGDTTGADSVNRNVRPEEINGMRDLVRRFLPAADGPLIRSAVCLYTNTPDHHFFIDEHPAHPQVLIASPCSGHGFKFAPAIGEILCAWATQRKIGFDLRLFRRRRDQVAMSRAVP